MSINSWKAEFYPTDAVDTRRDEAIQHTLRKWKGTQSENLAKHEMEKAKYAEIIGLTEEDHFYFGSGSCALCVHYTCSDCPLQQHTNYTCSDPGSQYKRWVLENNPEPMIKALEEILAMEQS